MGIPKLVSLLQPYASRISLADTANTSSFGENSKFLRGQVLSQREEIRDGDKVVDATRALEPTAREAIIDGPALSYHAYGLAVASRNNASNALDAIPSYTEVNAIVLDCLSVLENHGYQVTAIFFDGVLPPSKEPTRFERLNSCRKQLENFRNSNPSLIPEPGKSRRIVPRLPFSYSNVPEKLKGLPALPFLVPAVIEVLNESRYQNQTRVVPAEADEYCAKHASLHGGTIFTSDSDLLVYDMNEKTSVVLFKDIEFIESSQGNVAGRKSTLQITKFDLTAITRRLDLGSLQPFAYSVQKDHYRGFNGCLNYAKKLQANGSLQADELLQTNFKLLPHELKSYQEFQHQYSLISISLIPPATFLEQTLQHLDPRISEWIHLALDSQLRNGKEGQKVKTMDYAQQILDMYLPFPIDDPTRGTCWTLGLSIRQLAFSILRPGKHTTNEWTRRGPRIGEKKVEHLSNKNEVAEGLREWIHFLLPLQTEIIDEVLFWRLVGWYSVYVEVLETGRPLPGREVLRNLLSRQKGAGRDWNVVHFEAQVQAVLYSWRMLRQCILVHIALRDEERTTNADLDVAVDGISDILSSMPGIACLFDTTVVDEKVVEYAIEQLYNLLGVKADENKTRIQEDEDGFRAASKKRRKRKKDELKSKLPAPKAAKTPRAANLFDVLGVDR